MKNTLRLVIFILSIAFLNSCEDKPAPPVVTTVNVTDISFTTATSGGGVTSTGGSAVTARGVCWNTSASPTISNSKTTEIDESATFISNMTGLTANTLYYVRAYATNSEGSGYGNQVTFTTNPAAVPSITTTAISTVTKTTAISGGNVTADNGNAVTVRGICWSTTQNPTIELSTKTTNGTGTGSFISSMTGLTLGTPYYVRAYATNNVGTTYGTQVNFTTATTATLPSIITTSVSGILHSSATISSTVISDGDANITIRGFCWKTSANPTITDNKTDNGSGTTAFYGSIAGLASSTTYYVRAYATNSIGTSYGNELSFTTNGTVTDINGNAYKTVTIGTQVWMAENLRTTKYQNGDSLTNIKSSSTWGTLTTGAYTNYNNESSISGTYGRLYNWYAASDSRNIAPAGWHVATDADWAVLIAYAGDASLAGVKLKEAGNSHWAIIPNTAPTNETGFSALPGGYRFTDGSFSVMGTMGFWWSSTEFSATHGLYRYMTDNPNSVMRHSLPKQCGFSIRCVKN